MHEGFNEDKLEIVTHTWREAQSLLENVPGLSVYWGEWGGFGDHTEFCESVISGVTVMGDQVHVLRLARGGVVERSLVFESNPKKRGLKVCLRQKGSGQEAFETVVLVDGVVVIEAKVENGEPVLLFDDNQGTTFCIGRRGLRSSVEFTQRPVRREGVDW